MAFIGSKSLRTLLKGSEIILPFEEDNIKNGAYELSLGSQVFETGTKPRAVKKLDNTEEFFIEPGQFALLLTEETVKVPKNKIAFISIKAGIKFEGLVNVSGFHVDPGFEGKLLFSVYNAGPSIIALRRGKRYFPMWFAELNELQDYEGEHKNQKDIPLGAITALSQGELASPSVLSKRVEEIRTELDKKIGLVEKEQTAKDYLVKTAVGLGIIIIIKFILDWTAYDNGFKKGLELKEKELKLDSLIHLRLIEEKQLINEIDSLRGQKKKKENGQSTNKIDSIKGIKSTTIPIPQKDEH